MELKVGDRVTTDFIEGEEAIVRRVTFIKESVTCQGGLLVCVDGGEPCGCCGRSGTEIKGVSGFGIDSSWFKKVEEKK
jgi:hypothetical protein